MQRSIRFIVFTALVAPLACSAARGGVAPSAASIPGFDTRVFPGEAAMRAWRSESPYRWVGYYLPAPCFTDTSWIGRRALLHDIGWGTAVLFVGEQDWAAMGRSDTTIVTAQSPRCTATNLSSAKGAEHARAAESAASKEGFAAETPIFLDVERVDSVSSRLRDYVRAWFDAMLAGNRYAPALYAHANNVSALREIGVASFRTAGRDGAPLVWVARAGDLALNGRVADSGVLDAAIWQGVLDRKERWGGSELTIDVSIASRAVPGLERD